jgi:hypothetical protein
MSELLFVGIVLVMPVTQLTNASPERGTERAARAPETTALKRQTEKLIQEIRDHGEAYANLRELTGLGHRLSGSPGNEKAVRWAAAKMKSYSFDRVWLQEVSVPRWERGNQEQAELLLPGGPRKLRIAALGTSVGTAPEGITAPVVEVKSLKEVEEQGKALEGKIVFYNRPMNPALNPFQAYGEAGDQRTLGPATAAKVGAAAALVRSLTALPDDDHPHTGITNFADGTGPGNKAAIPAAALSVRAANELSRALKKDPGLKVRLFLSARQLPDVTSYNVIGEIRGRQAPERDEIVFVGAHLDSWDLATGAHDDGAGVVQALEVLRAFKVAGLVPKRTVRVILFAAEEFGMVGGKEYARQAIRAKERHFGSIESDSGGFAPQGFRGGGARRDVVKRLQTWLPYLQPLKAAAITSGPGWSEAAALQEHGMLAFALAPDPTHYFDVHHSALDRIEAVNQAELTDGAAALAVFTYLLAEQGIPAE